MLKERVYLIGQISAHEQETYDWRKRIKEEFKDEKEFEFIDPCLTEYGVEVLKTKEQNRNDVYKPDDTILIVPKDKNNVIRSTIAVANMNHYDKSKPIIGTLFELAWYHDYNYKAVIGIYDGDIKEDIHCNHPFVRSVINCWAKDVDGASAILRKYFKHNN